MLAVSCVNLYRTSVVIQAKAETGAELEDQLAFEQAAGASLKERVASLEVQLQQTLAALIAKDGECQGLASRLHEATEEASQLKVQA